MTAPDTQPCPECGGRGQKAKQHAESQWIPMSAPVPDGWTRMAGYDYTHLKQLIYPLIDCPACGGTGQRSVTSETPDDLVARLREWAEWDGGSVGSMLAKAADRIEALEAEADTLRVDLAGENDAHDELSDSYNRLRAERDAALAKVAELDRSIQWLSEARQMYLASFDKRGELMEQARAERDAEKALADMLGEALNRTQQSPNTTGSAQLRRTRKALAAWRARRGGGGA